VVASLGIAALLAGSFVPLTALPSTLINFEAPAIAWVTQVIFYIARFFGLFGLFVVATMGLASNPRRAAFWSGILLAAGSVFLAHPIAVVIAQSLLSDVTDLRIGSALWIGGGLAVVAAGLLARTATMTVGRAFSSPRVRGHVTSSALLAAYVLVEFLLQPWVGSSYRIILSLDVLVAVVVLVIAGRLSGMGLTELAAGMTAGVGTAAILRSLAYIFPAAAFIVLRPDPGLTAFRAAVIAQSGLLIGAGVIALIAARRMLGRFAYPGEPAEPVARSAS